ncbi:MAG: hypothetical protein U1C50_02490 [Patescibacteria group bacterium]|nr:hypothetical protein [Patescibacteria group bacterium]
MALPLLISGGNQALRLKQVDLVPGPDLMVVDPVLTIGISSVRSVEKFLQRRPYQKAIKTVVFTRADKLTLPAQHALLKTLEEPPAHSQIILLCDSEEQLLATIVSRCLVRHLAAVTMTPDQLQATGSVFEQLCQASTSQKLALVTAHSANTETAQAFVTAQLHYLHQQLKNQPQTVNVQLIKALNQALMALKFNVNPKLTLEVLSLHY